MLPVIVASAWIQNGPPTPLPKPYATKSVIRVPKLFPAPSNFLRAPRGFRVSLYADGLVHPRMMAVAPNGDVFVVETRIELKGKQPHRVVVLSDPGRLRRATERSVYSEDVSMPFGIAFAFGHLYVANTGSIVRWPYRVGDRQAPSSPETVLAGIPQDGYRNHWTRNIRFSPDRRTLFLTIGSELNVAEEGPRRAVIEAYDVQTDGRLDGSSRQRFAFGMRNPIGLDINPVSGALWANVAERDYLGDDLVPDYLTSVKRSGFYGWPNYYMGRFHDPRMPVRPALRNRSIAPDVPFLAHSTPIDVRFCVSRSFPSGFRGDAFVTLHGSQNRSKLDGYKVVRVRFRNGRPTGEIDDFVVGWLPKGSNRKIYGRPAGLAFLPDGSLLVADDWGGRIWRVASTR